MRAETVLRLVSGALQDLEPGLESRWPWEGDAERIGLLDFLNAAVRAVALHRPDVCAVTEAIRLEPGMRQHIPCRRLHGASRDATGFIELIRNMGADGGHPGPAIVAARPELLLAWADAQRSGPVVENFAYDRLTNSSIYYVYPAVPEGCDVWVEATYSAPPPGIVSAEQPLPLPDDYAQALTHHMLASILSGDNESSNAGKASYHMQLFSSLLGVKTQVDTTWPRARNSMGDA